MNQGSERLLLTVPQVAEQFHLNPSRTYGMLRAGVIPGLVRIGRRSVRVDARRLDHFIASGGCAGPVALQPLSTVPGSA